MNFVMPNFIIVAPEIFLFSMACVILLIDIYAPRKWDAIAYWLTQASLLGAALITIQTHTPGVTLTFNNMFIDDLMSDVLKVAVYIVTMAVFLYSRDYIRARDIYRGEYFVLGLFGVVGIMVMISASHFLSLYLGLELMSLSLYAMVAFQRDSSSATEAAMKYFVLGALSSGMLLYGMSMLYGITGSLEIATVQQKIATLPATDMVVVFGLVFVVVGIGFKLGAVPFHMWLPDVYHGAPTSVTLYLGTIPKLGAYAMAIRLLVDALPSLVVQWQDMLIIMAVLSMALGNLVAIAQTNLKRMLAYSTISHMGFFLLGILSGSAHGYGAAMFYMLMYVLMGLGAFGMIILLSRAGFEADRLEDFKGLNQRHPWYAFLMLLLMFAMAGVPPTAGFYAKLSVIQAVVEAGMVWLAVAAVLFSVIGAYYYLRVVKLMYFDAPVEQVQVSARGDMKVLISLNALGVIAITPWVGSLMSLCRAAMAPI